jgi:hypothetical protein
MLLVILILLAGGLAFAGTNIDPTSDGSKYAWAENLGWINLQPGGPGGPGVEVSDSGLAGWAWAENAGWISLSCQNTSSCATNAYGVTNSLGTLSGYAWSENAGWINFAPTGAGVVINGCSGVFGGRAWSENAGWITFSSTGPNPYQVATSWRLNCNDNNPCTDDSCNAATGCAHTNNTASCDDGNACTASDVCGGGVCSGTTVTAPPETQTLLASDATTFIWAAATFATRYDVVRGGLGALPVGPDGGDEFCFDNLPGTSVSDSVDPAPGTGFWYLSRGENACGNGPYGQQSNGTQRITTTCP